MAKSTTYTTQQTADGLTIIKVTVTAGTGTPNALTDSAVVGGMQGKKLLGAAFTNGATGFTTTCDLGIVDSVTGKNFVTTSGAAVTQGNSTAGYVIPDTTFAPYIVTGNLTIKIDQNDANVVNNATGVVYVFLTSKLM